MSTRKLTRAIQLVLQQTGKITRFLTKGLVTWLLRTLLVLGRQSFRATSGFVLPTTVLLLLVLTLTVGSIGYRTYTRTVQTTGERQQRVIFNAATPAIDRAKSKIEYLFDIQKDPRFPGGIPSEGQLLGMLYNDERTVQPGNVRVAHHPLGRPEYDPYTFPDETRVVLPGDAQPANAWRYRADTNGDGTLDATVAYSVLFKTDPIASMRNASQQAVRERANKQVVRHGPLSNSPQANAACQLATTGAAPVEQGWFRDETNTSVLRKNFQVNAFVLPDNRSNGTVSTLEFFQDRQVNRGNKWGAWFRNDLEIFPGPQFNWNGAMHTEGNLFVQASEGPFTSYLISAPASCLYTKEASEITVTNIQAVPQQQIPAFQGQFISGTLKANTFGTPQPTRFHLFNAGQPGYIAAGAGVNFRQDTDSVNGGATPADYALDPVRLQTEDVSTARNLANSAANRDPGWTGRQFVAKERMKNLQEKAPYVDDSFRADNRYGPKPRYAGEKIQGFIGGDISNVPELIGNDPAAGADDTSVGLDGYWERRARREGLRVIVGQRLELGDPAGWGGPVGGSLTQVQTQEPLRPWLYCSGNNSTICNEARQRRTLWDNLAAVQAAAIYHAAAASRDYPVVCLASTVHPGTPTTLAKSSTFENLIYSNNGVAQASPPDFYIPGYGPADLRGLPGGVIQTDFFRGRGTNGWEFEPPPESVFRNPSSPMMIALKNLATFAGDPDGGAPSFTPVQDSYVHPYPSMAMWGDFSMLRRVLERAEQGYDTLSPADLTVLHTAACTVGMLAYNIDYLENFNPTEETGANPEDAFIRNTLLGASGPFAVGNPNGYRGLRGRIRELLDNQVDELKGPANPQYNFPAELSNYLSPEKSNPEAIVRLLEQWRDALIRRNPNDPEIDKFNQEIYLAQLIITKEQVARDRTLGFFGSGDTDTQGQNLFGKAPLGHCTEWVGLNTAANGSSRTSPRFEPLAALCSNRPRYPILYSLFPAKDDAAPQFPANDFVIDPGEYAFLESHAEEYGRNRDSVDSNDAYITGRNQGLTYTVVDPGEIALRPLPLTASVLPKVRGVNTNAVDAPNNNRDTLIKICSRPCLQASSGQPITSRAGLYATGTQEFVRIPFKDAALYNGRELMSVRVMDMNIDLMRNSPYGSNSWLPASGIIYAYREDAVSEQEIVRPATGGADWSTCGNNTQLETNASCRMNTGNIDAFASTDPPVSEDNAITPKPVDYYADPDRRPFGFRLKNAARLDRPGDQGRGMSLISDNPIYIQGNFNLHQNAAGTRLEEFQPPLLDDNFGNFYIRTNLDQNFSRPQQDLWRPAEVLADAITLLSDNFCDGTIKDAISSIGLTAIPNTPTNDYAEYGCPAGTSRVTSYLNQNRPLTNPTANSRGVRWMHTNSADSIGVDPRAADAGTGFFPRREGDSPIFFTVANNPLQMDGANASIEFSGSYAAMNSDKPLIAASDNLRMNSIFISGIIPSRANQSYGGLHNFPRFIENWGGRSLYINGSFLQLNFSNSAVAPFDQDSFEVGAAAQPGDELIKYYGAPNRRWGYDVGLQYAPAGPLAQRFVTAEAKRSEFYLEPPANDPYIRNLCLAIPNVPANTCPPL